MKYHAYQTQSDLTAQMHFLVNVLAGKLAISPFGQFPGLEKLSAACQVFAATEISHSRPEFRIKHILMGEGDHAKQVRVTEEVAHTEPFCTLLHFKKDVAVNLPRVLLVAPMSGHFATLLCETARTMLQDHDVYITDWHNARDVPLADGRFGMDDYVRYLIKFMAVIGPGAHMVAICQPCVTALAATAIMAEDHHPAAPRSLTLMAGPIDTRISPTKVNELATGKPLQWFKNNLISTVPIRYSGGMRRVYPGFLQLCAFLSMNLQRHVQAFRDLYDHILSGDSAKADAIKAFYKEYFAVLDLPAEFYLETVQYVFQEHALPSGTLKCCGRIVNPSAIHRTALLTVEGERDDICGLGQTMAAHELCSNIPPSRQSHHLQAGVGHYGVFSGRRWSQQIYPLVREVILENQ